MLARPYFTFASPPLRPIEARLLTHRRLSFSLSLLQYAANKKNASRSGVRKEWKRRNAHADSIPLTNEQGKPELPESPKHFWPIASFRGVSRYGKNCIRYDALADLQHHSGASDFPLWKRHSV